MPPSDKLILIADDDPGMRMILNHILSAEGYRIVTAENGREALELAIISSPDLLLLDMNMPHLTGLGVVEALSEQNPPRIPQVILLTAEDGGEVKDRVEQRAEVTYMEKPFDLDALLRTIRERLGE